MVLSQINEGVVEVNEVSRPEFSEKYDVIVAGLGTSGAIAAITATRKGLKVLGIERMNCMGGTSTAGNVNSYYFGSTGGIYEEIDKKVDELHGIVYAKTLGFSIEAKKFVLEQEAGKMGAVLEYESTVIGVYLDGNKVKGVRWIGPEGVKTAECKILIDCTGDAAVCHMAGCSTGKGRELDRRTQPFTSVKVFTEGKRVKRTNFDSGSTDQFNVKQFSRELCSAYAAHLNHNINDQRLLYLAPLPGIREGRRIEGDKTITLADVFDEKVTDRPVFYAYADIDKHGQDIAFESETLQDWSVASNLGAVNVSIPVSLSHMIPKGFEGILAAGRCISMDHDVSACIRMNRDMQKAGEVAGTAAWLAVTKGISLREVPYEELSLHLQRTGCLDAKNNVGVRFDYTDPSIMPQKIRWFTDEENIKEGLSSNRPGIAIWSSKIMGERICNKLVMWMNEGETENLRKHSAIALGLLGNKEALPVLRNMVKERDHVILQDCRKNNQMRGIMALYLLGRMRDSESIDELAKIICDPDEINRSLYGSTGSVRKDNGLVDSESPEKFNKVYFQFFSHSVMALIKIGNRHIHLRQVIKDILKKALENGEYRYRITNAKPMCYEYSVVENIERVVAGILKHWESGNSQASLY